MNTKTEHLKETIKLQANIIKTTDEVIITGEFLIQTLKEVIIGLEERIKCLELISIDVKESISNEIH